MKLGQCSGPKTPEDKYRGGHYGDANSKEANRDKFLLPELSSVARCGDWRKGRSPENGSKGGYEPVPIGAIERGPIGNGLRWL